MKGPLAWALTPLRRYADFQGRSTRTELVFFYILVCGINIILSFATASLGALAQELILWTLGLALLCPTVALSVRRLHDTGRSGWWLLLEIPVFGVGMWRQYLRDQQPFTFPPLYPPWFVTWPTMLIALVLLVMLLWKDEEEANRYGPNPRYEIEPAA